MKFKSFGINENLDGRPGGYNFSVVSICNFILKLNLCAFVINVSYFYPHGISITQRVFIITIHRYYGHNQTMIVEIKIAHPEFSPEFFPCIFHISNVMAMPHNAERVGFIKTYDYICGVGQHN